MKLHIHIPKLHEFALYAACDDVVKRGAACLIKPMPRPLYYLCIMTFAEKYDRRLSLTRLYYMMCHNNELKDGNMVLNHSSILHHVILASCNVSEMCSLFHYVAFRLSDESVVCDIARFAVRCIEQGFHEIMVTVFCNTLEHCPPRAVRDVLVKYGAFLDPNSGDFVYKSCGCGAINVVQLSTESDVVMDEQHLIKAIESGKADLIKLIAPIVMPRLDNLDDMSSINAIDIDDHICNVLVSLGIIRDHQPIQLYNIRYISVIRCLMRHDALDVEYTYKDVAYNAAVYGESFVGVLEFLVEHSRTPMPGDVLVGLQGSQMIDLSVVDYLVHHGADVGVRDHMGTIFALSKPALMRYWIDNGINDRIGDVSGVAKRLVSDVSVDYTTPTAADVAAELVSIDIKSSVDIDSLNLFLSQAVNFKHWDSVSFFIKHGADINRHTNGSTYLHVACEHRLIDDVIHLLDSGANVNAKTDNLNDTPLHVVCKHNNTGIARVLLEHGADVYAVNSAGHAPLDIAMTFGAETELTVLLSIHGGHRSAF